MPHTDFPPDDFDIAFESPPRRAARPASQSGPRKSAPARAKSVRAPQAAIVIVEKEADDRPANPRPATKTKHRAQTKRPARPPRRLRAVHYEVLGVLLVAFGGLLGYYSLQSVVDGALPRLALNALRLATGVGAVAIPFALAALGALLLIKRGNANLRSFCCGAGVALLVLLTARALAIPRGEEFFDLDLLRSHGGYLGAGIAYLLRRALGDIGAIVALVALAIVALLLWTEHTVGEMGDQWRAKLGEWAKAARKSWKNRSAHRRSERAERKSARQHRLSTDDYHDDDSETDEDQFADDPNPPRALPRRIVREAHAPAAQLPLPLRDGARPSPFLPLDDLIEIAPTAPLRRPAPNDNADARANNDNARRDNDDARGDNDNSRGDSDNSRRDSDNARGDSDDAHFDSDHAGDADAPPDRATVAVDPESFIAAPKFAPPRVELLDAAPPISVVGPPDDLPDINLRAVVAGDNADDDLTPSEALEAQAQSSAKALQNVAMPLAVRIERPRRRFGDGPLMPEYFDDGVRALDAPIPPDNAGAEEEIQAGVEGVQETLASFKIDARVTDVKRGPVITRYEVQPGAGVRVNAIANLDKDLARSLSALAVRIEAPVPGKNVVGIEIPNKKVHLVRMRDVLEQPDFLAHPSKLAFVLGKDIAGQPKWGDLTKMPHMLIAGATNSGKSVCLNSIIASILVRARPDEVRFSLIDPKRVELTLYKGIRHLMHDVVVEPKQAVIALRRAIEEMDRRYKLFAARGVRNIVSHNAKLKPGEKPLPYIVIVIDELADLMMTAAAEFEKLICRLAQLARATGIHLIVATQRPSVNVITGVIKANIPARIAFAVASQVDSRTILDSVGAERLIGSGDMLYDSNNGGKSTRIQGAYLSEEEVNRVVEVVKAAYQYDDDDEWDDLPEFDLFVPDDDDDDGFETPSDEKRDVLYDEIVEFCKRHQEMSASNIQRKFGIGYPRAGRIVDQLERHGILGPADGPKPRKVLAQMRDESDE